jgi:hypothetical protein
MTKRSTPRKRRAPRSRANSAAAPPERGNSRSQRRNEEARAALEPLAQGDRPGAVTVGAIAAAALAVANLVALIVGYDPGEGQKTASSLLGTAILVVVAVGMWNVRYWAVLGMQALLAVTMLLVSLALIQAVNLVAVILCCAILGFAGVLFWKLVKAMARIQMPERPGAAQR